MIGHNYATKYNINDEKEYENEGDKDEGDKYGGLRRGRQVQGTGTRVWGAGSGDKGDMDEGCLLYTSDAADE